MSETSETPTPPPHQTPKVFKAAAWVAIAAGTVFIVAVIFFTGYILGKHAGHGGFHHRQHHQHPAMMLRPGSPHGGPAAVRPGPGPAGPARCRRPSVLPRHPLRNRQPAARCPPKAPGCTSSWHVCNRNPLRWLPAERYSKDDRDTPTRSATAVRRHNFTAAIAAAGKAAQALPGRSVGGDRGRNCFHRRSHLLLWRVGSRAGEMPLPPLLPPRHVPPRRSRCPRSRDGMGVRVPRRTPSPRHGPRFPWRPGWPGCWSDWSGSHHRAGAPLAAGRTSPFS